MNKFIAIIVAFATTFVSHNAHARISATSLFEPAGTASFSSVQPAVSFPQKEAENSISVSYGIISGIQAVYSFASVLGFFFTVGLLNLDNLQYSGCVSLDYMHSVSRLMDFGFVVSTDNIRGNRTVLNMETGKYEYIGTFNETYSCLMPQARVNYLKRQHFALYGKAALGVCWHHSEQRDKDGADTTAKLDSFNVGLHLTPIGCEAGGRNVRGFVELGMGWLGILSLGARFRF